MLNTIDIIKYDLYDSSGNLNTIFRYKVTFSMCLILKYTIDDKTNTFALLACFISSERNIYFQIQCQNKWDSVGVRYKSRYKTLIFHIELFERKPQLADFPKVYEKFAIISKVEYNTNTHTHTYMVGYRVDKCKVFLCHKECVYFSLFKICFWVHFFFVVVWVWVLNIRYVWFLVVEWEIKTAVFRG